MRRLFPKGDAPPTLAAGSDKAYEALDKQIRASQKTLSFNTGLYGSEQVRSALNISHYGKCAFCEVIIEPAATAQVEHFRPKGAVINEGSGTLQRPGYFYLAYQWDNLLLACPKCNSATYKGNRFPLRDERQRAASKAELSREKPLLLNPFLEDPRKRIHFRRGVAFPIKGDTIADVTIKLLGLNREPLVDARREHLVYVKSLASSAINDPDPKERAIFAARLKFMLSPRGQYAACVADELMAS